MKITSRSVSLFLALASLLPASAKAIEFKADEVNYDMNTSETMCEKNVLVEHQGNLLASDKAKLNVEKSQAHAEGNVVLVSQDEIYFIGTVDFDFTNETGTGSGGATYQYPWIIEGEKIEKKGEDIIVDNATIRPSTTDDPAVSFKVKKVIIENKKYLILKNITQYVSGVPVFWFPYAKKNIGDDRSELTFSPGSNSRYGAYLKSAYRYWFTSDIYARAHVDFLESRGVGLGADVGLESEKTKGNLKSYYIQDQEYEPVRGPAEDAGEMDRYGVSLKTYHLLPDDWTFSLQANKQSDIDFYDDFFYDEFQDEIQMQDFASLSRSTGNSNLNIIVEERLNDFFTVLKKEPEITYTYNNYAFEEYRIFHVFTAQAAQYDLRYADDAQEGPDLGRYYMKNEVSRPMKFWGWFNVRPSAYVENVYYSEARQEDEILRNIGTGEVDFFVKFYRTMYPEKKFLGNDRLRHIFEPHLTYTYRPEPGYADEEVYQLTDIDYRPEQNHLKIDLRNVLQAKTGENQEARSLLSGSFFIYYQFLSDEFSDIGYQWDVRPVENISIDLAGTIDRKEGDISESSIDLAFYQSDLIGYAMGWIYRKDANNLVSPEIFMNISHDVFLRGLVRYDYEAGQSEYNEVSLVKQAKGMNLAIQYRDRSLRDEESIMLVFSLTDYPRTNIALR